MNRFLYGNDRFLALLLILFFLVADRFPPIQALEWMAYDRAMTATHRPPEARIVLITIDETSIARQGPWPWNELPFVRLLEILNQNGAKVIGFTFPLPALPPDAQPGPLSRALRANGNVVLGLPPHRDGPAHPAPRKPPPYLLEAAIPALDGGVGEKLQPMTVPDIRLPEESLGSGAARIGVALPPAAADPTMRSVPLVVQYRDIILPSLALAVVAHFQKLDKKWIRLHPDGGLDLGETELRTWKHWAMLPQFPSPADGHAEFATYPMHEILAGNIPSDRLRGRIALVGLTSPMLAPPLVTPGGRAMTPLEIQAHAVAAILNRDPIVIPSWAGTVRYLLYLVAGVLLLFALPSSQPRTLPGILGLSVLLLLPLGVILLFHFRFMTHRGFWVPMMGPAALLASGFLLLVIVKQALFHRPHRSFQHMTIAENNRMLGLAFQGQGKGAMAWEKFLLCPMDADMMHILDRLALDFERARRFAEATQVYLRMTKYDAHFPHLQERLQNAMRMADQEEETPAGILDRLPTELGPCRVTEEVASDALGALFLAHHREREEPVLLRVMPRGPSTNATEIALARLWERDLTILRGLHHRGVVAVLDASQIARLFIVAMESFSPRHAMDRYLSPDNPMPLPLLLHAMIQAALALDYVHQQGVTHGNLGPRELIFDPEGRVLKIRDFGVARFLGRHPAGSGLSPYSAPEAVNEHIDDPRSDLYALGAIFMHLLTGQPPFREDDPEELRQRILSPLSPTRADFRSDIPPELAGVLVAALRKDPEQRYQRGADMARDLLRFVKSRAAREKDQRQE
ncbi:MAG: CHASE2 domain-containing protein [Magnetococcales bacterium]|nr:CHASE2 domain-containing protein [Magnetococcales bacterium]